MKLGFQLGHWGRGGRLASGMLPREAAERMREAEGWGCDSVWAPESYHGDAFTFLSWIGAQTERIKLGTAVVPIQARTPAACAQACNTLDHLSRGRVQVGVGVTGVDVAEAWHGQRFSKPLAQTREYVSVMRAVLAGARPDNPGGEYFRLPVRGGVTQRSTALKSPVKPFREDLPILIGAMGPRNIALAAEIADGWIAAFFIPECSKTYEDLLTEGFGRSGARRSWADFQIITSLYVFMDDDLDCAAARVRSAIAHSINAMGNPHTNFQFDLFCRAGFEEACARSRALWREGRRDAAAGAIPMDMVDAVALVGPRARIRDNLQRWRASKLTTLNVRGDFQALRAIAEVGGFD